jgi:short-subunit dehydrogenase
MHAMRVRLDGATVLLTGASSGIGLEMARQLAPRAKELILVARRVDRLEALRAELTGAHPQLQVRLLPCDLSDAASVQTLADDVEKAVGAPDILVNNAGYGDAMPFYRADWAKLQAMMLVNMNAVLQLTRRFLPKMVERKSGGILNMSSLFGFAVLPGFATYLASKHFMTAFSETLRIELFGSGVSVTQVCPGPVDTEFNQVSNSDRVSPGLQKLVRISGKTCARIALAGFERGRALVIPGLIPKMLKWFLGIAPAWLVRWTLYPMARRLLR